MQLPWHEGELSEGRWPAPEQGKAIDLVSLTNRTAELALLKMPIADATTVALKLDEWVCAFARQACCVRAEDEGLRALNRCFLVIHWWQLVAHLAVARGTGCELSG